MCGWLSTRMQNPRIWKADSTLSINCTVFLVCLHEQSLNSFEVLDWVLNGATSGVWKSCNDDNL